MGLGELLGPTKWNMAVRVKLTAAAACREVACGGDVAARTVALLCYKGNYDAKPKASERGAG